jgi:ectoine hydroxylase-related dioxygenase (phytanoyl-CoA dioxygenase family)
MLHELHEQGWYLSRQGYGEAYRLAALEWLRSAAAHAESDQGLEAQFEEGYLAGKRPVRKMRRLFWNDPQFWKENLEASGVFQLARTLVPGETTLILHATFMKSREVGSTVGLHQDQALWDNPYPGAVSVWIALTDSMPVNGCLIFYPDTHHCGLIPHTPDPADPWHPIVTEDTLNRIELNTPREVPMAAGDILSWHRYMVHGSGPNRSDHDRIGTVLVFANAAEPDFVAKDTYRL